MSIFGFLKKKGDTSKNKTKPVVLLVLDGYGIAPASVGNAITQANTPNMDSYKKSYINGKLIASGESVGLPANEPGNTEVGHLTMGAGRVVLQDIRRINQSIEDESFFKNSTLMAVKTHVIKNKSKLHIITIVSSGNVHGSFAHTVALIKFCKRQAIEKVYLHVITDGRDAPPTESLKKIAELEKVLKEKGVGKIASISGRYYAMDRDARWDRTKKMYDMLTKPAGKKINPIDVLKNSHTSKITDEFIEPVLVDSDGIISDSDGVIFANFRMDRAKQLTMAFTISNFEKVNLEEFGHQEFKESKTFKRDVKVKDLFFVTMTMYHEKLKVQGVIFEPQMISSTLSQVISDNKLNQLSLTESEKERFVTFYFNGQKEELFKNQEVKIVESPKVATYDKKPEMSADQIVKKFSEMLAKDHFHFIIINLPNADMVAHSGNVKATIAAIEATDKAVGEIVKATTLAGGSILITADHGNAEELLTYPTKSFFFTTKEGNVNTDHSQNLVPVIFIGPAFSGKKLAYEDGALSDIAPTILVAMKLQIPKDMQGKNLLQ